MTYQQAYDAVLGNYISTGILIALVLLWVWNRISPVRED